MADEQEDSTWDSLKKGFVAGFKPADARADEEVKANQKQYGNQYQQDKSQGAQYMRDKFKKGFFGN